MKHEATRSQAGEVSQLAQFSWRFLPSMLSELLHYRHLVLSARVITFVTITQLDFMLHAFMHSKSIFLGACVITWVTFQRCFLQLFMIYIEVRSKSTLTHIGHVSSVFSFMSVSFLWFLFISFKIFLLPLNTLKLMIFLFILMDFYDFVAYVFATIFFKYICIHTG